MRCSYEDNPITGFTGSIFSQTLRKMMEDVKMEAILDLNVSFPGIISSSIKRLLKTFGIIGRENEQELNFFGKVWATYTCIAL